MRQSPGTIPMAAELTIRSKAITACCGCESRRRPGFGANRDGVTVALTGACNRRTFSFDKL